MSWITRLFRRPRRGHEPALEPDRLTVRESPFRTTAKPIPITLTGPRDKMTMTLNMDIWALELLHDREGAVDAAAQRAGDIIRGQLGVTTVCTTPAD
jgi:hypothetical protein